MPVNRRMDKEGVVHMHSGMLLSHKKKCIWVSSDEVDEPRTYYTEWSESERERYISYSNAHIRNLEKWFWRIYLQGSNGETDTENRLADMGEGRRGWDGERVTWKLTLPYVTWRTNRNWLYGSGNSNRGFFINLEGWDGEGGGREVPKERDICMPMADSCWGLTENSKIL